MLLLACLFVGIGLVTAQTQKVTGVVISEEDGQPVIGASVLVKGTQIGAITNVDGEFTLQNVPSSAKTLQVSFVGMQTQEVAIKPRVRVILKSDTEVLDEVMVVAYGTAKKSSFTGAASSVSGDKALKDVPVVSFEQALQGSTPGVTVNSTSGQPGAALSIRVRGTGSMNASNNPLYVIDGVPVTSGDIAVSGVKGDSKSFNIMASLNPDDIENITVLKDAAAASLYGSRAANGVILITTKRGKEGKTKLNFKASWGMSDWAVDNYKTVNGDQQHELAYEAFYNEAIIYGGYSEEDAHAYAKSGTDAYVPKKDSYSDWKKAAFNKHGNSQSYEFSAQGGSDKTTFYASLAYKKEEGMVKTSNLESYLGRVNATHKSADEKIQMGVNLSFSKQDSEVTSEGTSYANPFFMTNWAYIPNTSIYNEDGSYNEGGILAALQLPNIIKDQGLDKNTSAVIRSFNSLWASYRIIEGLTLKQTLSYDFIFNESTTYWPGASNNGEVHKGLMIKIPYQFHNLYSSTVLNYANTFGAKHNIDALIGWDVDDKNTKYVQAVGSGYPNDKLPELENASTPKTAASGYSDDRLLSFLSRVNYDYDGKYYLSGTFRRDGSSRLGTNKRWGNFWSASAAWRISQESFMKGTEDIITDLKIRASYGVNGTLPSQYYEHLSLFGNGYNYQDNPGSAPSNIANPDLAWEKNYNLNIGFDARLFDRVNISFDYYNRDTKDLLQEVPTSMVVGFSNVLRNVGSMNNKGVELDISADVFKNSQVKWNTGLALSHNKNKVTKLYGGKDIISGSSILREGESYYSWWTRQWAGVDPETGEEQWVLNTQNEDGSLNKELTKNPAQAQRVVAGKPDPTVVGGWRNSVSWKGLELNALFSFTLGGHIMNDMALLYLENDGENFYTAIGEDQLKRWQKPGDITDVPRRINGYQYARYGSDRHMKSSNHLRLKTLSLSYALPSRLLRPTGINNLRVFVSGSNLLTWAAYKNVDPEQGITGVTSFAFPNTKSVTFGIEIGL